METTQQLVVVVEDDASMRQALKRLLLASGYRTHVFASAEALFAADGTRGADCLVLDVHLPGASGTELYSQLGSGRPPTVFITAHDGPDLRGTLALLGSNTVLPKPFLGTELIDAVARAIRCT